MIHKNVVGTCPPVSARALLPAADVKRGDDAGGRDSSPAMLAVVLLL